MVKQEVLDDMVDQYTYELEYDDEDEIVVATVKEWSFVKAHGINPVEAIHNIQGTVKSAIEDCIEKGDDFPKP